MTSRAQPRGRKRLRSEHIVLTAAAAITIVAVIWGGVVLAGRDDETQADDSASDAVISHVHGLGINPSDGSLIVATHFGSFRIGSGGDEAERIGGSFQDTMGFTVAGPDHFLGSGHPDVEGIRAGQPGRLGLIESVDAGVTWTSQSLSGEVDFHGLAFVHEQVYGWDAGTGRFMVSSDRQEWETRSTVDLSGFAVDPDDPDHVVAATIGGPVDSTDGGRTWSQADGPPLLAINWDGDAGLWGAGPEGDVRHYDGSTWRQTGELVGEPQALLATSDALYAAAHDADGVTGIYRSADEGRSWQLRYRDARQ